MTPKNDQQGITGTLKRFEVASCLRDAASQVAQVMGRDLAEEGAKEAFRQFAVQQGLSEF